MNQMTSIPRELVAPYGAQDPSRLPYSGHGIEREPEFVEYGRAVLQRKWAILALALLFAALAAYVVSLMTPVYRASSTVLIESTKAKLVSIEEVYTGVTTGREFFQTQAEVLKSRDVAIRVVRKLNLFEHPEFDPRKERASAWKERAFAYVPALMLQLGFSPPASRAISEGELEAEVLRRFAARLTVEPVRQSNLIKIRVDSADPKLAAEIANALGEAYIQSDLDNRVKLTQSAGTWINDRLADLKGKLESSERALQAYRDREGLFEQRGTTVSGVGRQFDELTNRLVDARVKRSEAEEAYNQVKSGESNGYDGVPAVVKSPAVQRAREIEAEAEKRVADVSQRYGPDHPRYATAESDLASARANTRKQIQGIVQSVLKEYNVARATEKAIEDGLSQSKSSIQNMNRKEIQLGSLERDVSTNRALYQTFLSRSRETNATSDSQQAIGRVIDPAVAPPYPIRPARTLTVLVAALAGLMLGVAGALVLRRLDTAIKTIGDVESKLGQPLLTALPLLGGKAKRDVARASIDRVHDVYAEGVRTASTGIYLSTLDSPRKIVGVTSSVPGEGKSTFAINLALTEAKTKRTLLVESDMRKPSIAKALSLTEAVAGLAELISGTASVDECTLRIEGTQLDVILCGRVPPNPLDLLMSNRFKELLVELRAVYDIIIIDCAPVQLVSDALIVGTMCTGMIYVVKADDTPLPMARAGIGRILNAHVQMLGVVLNRYHIKRAEKYYGEYSGYGKYSYAKAKGA